MRFLALILAFLIIAVIGLRAKAEIDLRYRRSSEMDNLEIDLRAFKGLWHFQWSLSKLCLEWEKGLQFGMEAQVRPSDEALNKEDIQEEIVARPRYFLWSFFQWAFPQVIRIITELREVKSGFYRSIQCTALEWKIDIGMENPMHTALAAGAFWTLIGTTTARLYKQVTVALEKPVLAVVPQFEKKGFSCDFHCTFKARMGHLIIGGLRLIAVFSPRKSK